MRVPLIARVWAWLEVLPAAFPDALFWSNETRRHYQYL
jgi:hypothetical protein